MKDGLYAASKQAIMTTTTTMTTTVNSNVIRSRCTVEQYHSIPIGGTSSSLVFYRTRLLTLLLLLLLLVVFSTTLLQAITSLWIREIEELAIKTPFGRHFLTSPHSCLLLFLMRAFRINPASFSSKKERRVNFSLCLAVVGLGSKNKNLRGDQSKGLIRSKKEILSRLDTKDT